MHAHGLAARPLPGAALSIVLMVAVGQTRRDLVEAAITAAGELKQLEYSQRLQLRARNVAARRPGESTGARLYRDALAGGAQALGRRIGSLAEGLRADIVVLDPEHPDLAAVAGDRWLDAYVFVAGHGAISSVFVGGDALVERGRHRAREAVAARYASAVRRLASA